LIKITSVKGRLDYQREIVEKKLDILNPIDKIKVLNNHFPYVTSGGIKL
jgi:hypothetical protein